jgi:hypothetical protein
MYSIHNTETLLDGLLALAGESKWTTAHDIFDLALAGQMAAFTQEADPKGRCLFRLLREVAPHGQLSVDCDRLETWLERHKGVEVEGLVLAKCADLIPRWRVVRVHEPIVALDPLPWEQETPPPRKRGSLH